MQAKASKHQKGGEFKMQYQYRNKRYKKAPNPIEAFIGFGLDALYKRVDRFVASELKSLARFKKKRKYTG